MFDRKTWVYTIEVFALLGIGITELIVTKELHASVFIFFMYGIFKVIKYIYDL